MKYTESEVLDIIKSATDKDPQEVFTNWVNRKANTPLDLTKHQYNHFVYTFPITIEGKDVGDITLVDLYHNTSGKEDLMLKYLGKEDYDISWDCFSHDTYLFCYLTIRKEFQLPEICKGLRGDTLKSVDANGRPFEFQISYGNPEKEKDSHYHYQWVDKAYRFDNGVSIQVNQMNGWSLGEKINENIEKRLNSKLKLKHWYPECRVLITENKTFFDSSFYFEVDNLPDSAKSHMEHWLDQMKNIESQWN